MFRVQVIRFTVLKEHAKLREQAEQAKMQLAKLQRSFHEIVVEGQADSESMEHVRLLAYPQLLWEVKMTFPAERSCLLQLHVEKTEPISHAAGVWGFRKWKD